jgi:hypothetical protein
MSYFIIGTRGKMLVQKRRMQEEGKKSRKKYKIMQEVSQKRSMQEEE